MPASPFLDISIALERESQGTGGLVSLSPRHSGELPTVRTTVSADVVRAARDIALTPRMAAREAAIDAGRCVGDVLLPTGVRATLLGLLLQEAVRAVRLRVQVSHPDLIGVPWELAWVDDVGSVPGMDRFLALSERVRLVRSPPLRVDPTPICAPELRVLLVGADPRSDLPNVEREIQAIHQILASTHQIRVEILRHATRRALQERLRQVAPHVLHFCGHGMRGRLLLEGGNPGEETDVSASELGEWITGTGVQLVVLAACRSSSPIGGIAEALSARGVPAVIAMQSPLRDAIAPGFARAFYGALAPPGLLPIEEALHEARANLGTLDPEWAMPVLHLATEHSALFLPERPLSNVPLCRSACNGRDRLFDAIHGAIAGPGGALALVGLPGQGKRHLAFTYAHRFIDHYPGGVFWVDARDQARQADSFAAIGHCLDPGFRERDPHGVLARLQRLPHRFLLICTHVTAETDFSLLPSTADGRVLMTADRRLYVPAGVPVAPVEGLPEAAALALLLPEGGDAGEAAAAREIAARLGHHALALRLVADHVRALGMRYAEYRDVLLENVPTTIIDAEEAAPPDLWDRFGFETLGPSAERLTPAARRMLTAAACFEARDIPAAPLFEAFGAERPYEARKAIAQLADAYFLSPGAEGRFDMHELVRAFWWERVTTQRDPVVTPCLEAVAAALARPLAGANGRKEWSAVRRDVPHVRAVEELCARQGLVQARLPLLRELGNYLFEHSDLPGADRCFTRALALLPDLVGGSPREAMGFYQGAAPIKQLLGDPEGALRLAERAVAIAEREFDGDLAGTADCYNGLGLVLKLQGRREEALDCYRKAQAGFERAHGAESTQLAMCLNNLGTLREDGGDLEEARRCLARAVTLHRVADGPRHQFVAITLNNLGRVLQICGEFETALRHHREALEIYEAAYDGRRHTDVAASLYYIGRALCALAHPAEALSALQEALETFAYFRGEDHRTTRRVAAALAEAREAGSLP